MHAARVVVMGLAAVLLLATAAAAQETGTPVFHGPYASFARYEFGASASFQRGSQTGVEGHYRRTVGPADLAFRAGRMLRGDGVQDSFLFGLQARVPVLPEERSPLRAAVVAGAGLDVSGGVTLWVPVGLSLGRRLIVEKSAVRLVPFVQPTLYFTSAGSQFEAGLGAGLDIRMSDGFEFRISGGYGTETAPRGVSASAIWLR